MEVNTGVVVQSTVDAIVKDYNAKVVQLAEGIQNRDKALEGLNKEVENIRAQNVKMGATLMGLKARHPDDEAFIVTDEDESEAPQ